MTEIRKRLSAAELDVECGTMLPDKEVISLLDLFLNVDIPHEALLPVLEQIYYGNEHPFVGAQRRVIAGHMVYVVQSWFESSQRRGERVPFGNEENAGFCVDLLRGMLAARDALVGEDRQEAEVLQSAVLRQMR